MVRKKRFYWPRREKLWEKESIKGKVQEQILEDQENRNEPEA